MKNEFGVPLDRNGYAPSIIQRYTERCYLCGGSTEKLDRHEPFSGPFREKSKRLGMWVTLCHHRCHLGAAHKEPGTAHELKRIAQGCAMQEYGWTEQEFIIQFGKSWL